MARFEVWDTTRRLLDDLAALSPEVAPPSFAAIFFLTAFFAAAPDDTPTPTHYGLTDGGGVVLLWDWQRLAGDDDLLCVAATPQGELSITTASGEAREQALAVMRSRYPTLKGDD